MTTNNHVIRSPASPMHRVPRHPFLVHFIQMIVAMVVGMVVLGMLVSALFALMGHGNLLHYAALRAMLMASYMTIGMSAWMRHQGHSWPRIREMAAAMFGPFVLLLVPFWIGLISGAFLLAAGHLLMLPAMLGAMLLRRDEYSQNHGQHTTHDVTARVTT